ncbi:1,4-alpha-glucan branching protein GlgB [Inquilinus sp. CAU 1745]|uniref:1,4-alpha-glucan branching protein GlgB n=1 Tax=Inquilinus sp. CAU 1745 TaxID=3140369 RepID=UPI00325B8022
MPRKAKETKDSQPQRQTRRPEVEAIVRADHGDPFAVLGPHRGDGGRGRTTIRVFDPGASSIQAVDPSNEAVLASLDRIHPEGFFEGAVKGDAWPVDYRLRIEGPDGTRIVDDPYRFGPWLGDLDIHLLGEGNHLRNFDRMGAHPIRHEGVEGVAFAVWAPNARKVSVVGDFNGWDGRVHPMRLRHGAGVWEIFLPGVGVGAHYKYEIRSPEGELAPLKSDPYAFRSEMRPDTASIVSAPLDFSWRDEGWMSAREGRNAVDAPISIYEVHLGSWRRVPEEGNRFLTYGEIADQLIPYVKEMGFTHIEMMPINEHPFDGSWGYQPTGLFAPTSRFGTPDEFHSFVERCHQEGIGLLLDWVPGHFPSDIHGLGEFDGTALYEHADPRQGFHMDWNTLIYNFGRTEVRNFLLGNALFWMDRYHLDGLRVDAVASMLYLDYSRKEGEWVPNRFGGRENLDAIDFLKRMNEEVFGGFPGATTVAEESTAWPGVSRPTYAGGLGFAFKWNMGWMHDTLQYMSKDPIHRRYHHHDLTFGLLYAFSENFILPLSHDEVVHGKGSLIGKMPGDEWRKFANLRAYYAFMWTHPGKKLLFMGGEFAQVREWNHDSSLDWHLLDEPLHKGIQTLVRDLNHLYRDIPALHQNDCDPSGFVWIEAQDIENSVLAFMRKGREGTRPVLVICNFTPMPRQNYRIGVPTGGYWQEIFNSDAALYGGGDIGNAGGASAEEIGSQGRPYSLSLTLPPLGVVLLQPSEG